MWLTNRSRQAAKLQACLRRRRTGRRRFRQSQKQTGTPPPCRAGLARGPSRVEAQARHSADRLGRIYRGQPAISRLRLRTRSITSATTPYWRNNGGRADEGGFVFATPAAIFVNTPTSTTPRRSDRPLDLGADQPRQPAREHSPDAAARRPAADQGRKSPDRGSRVTEAIGAK